MPNKIGIGALGVVTPEARELVARRMILRGSEHSQEARAAAAQWLAANGTKPDRAEADRFLRWV